MTKFQWRRLKDLNRLIMLGAVSVLIGVLLLCFGHPLGIAVAGFGASLIVSRGYIWGDWFRRPPDE